MYYYIYDSFLSDKKYKKLLAQIETRLTDLGINGKINRLSFLKNINNIITDEIKEGNNTIVALGNDSTINKVINIIADLDVFLGIIPVGKEQKISKILGIPEGLAACETLSARIIKKINLGKVNNSYFVSSLDMVGRDIILECDNNFVINLEQTNHIEIINKNPFQSNSQLEITISNQNKKFFIWPSRFDISKLNGESLLINSKKSIPILLNDENKIIKTPAKLSIQKKKLSVIVGRSRQEKQIM